MRLEDTCLGAPNINADLQEFISDGLNQLPAESGYTRPDPCTDQHGWLRCVPAQRWEDLLLFPVSPLLDLLLLHCSSLLKLLLFYWSPLLDLLFLNFSSQLELSLLHCWTFHCSPLLDLLYFYCSPLLDLQLFHYSPLLYFYSFIVDQCWTSQLIEFSFYSFIRLYKWIFLLCLTFHSYIIHCWTF